MRKIFSSLRNSFHSTQFFGRTIVIFAFFSLFIKQIFVFLTYGELFKEATLGATLLHYVGYFVSDFLVCLILIGLMLINVLIKKSIIRLLNNILMLALFLLFLLDVFTMYFFQSRLSIFDMIQFIDPSVGNFTWVIVGILIALLILGLIIFSIAQSINFKRHQKIFLSLCVLMFSVAGFLVGVYVPGGFTSLPDNIITTNFSAIKDNFGEISENNIPDTYPKFFGKKMGLQKQPNIIVVFAESLSPIDSLRVGGVNDNLPYFDLIQKQGITFTNFIANGCTSDTAHIGLLLGIEPLKLMGSQVSSYSGYTSYTDPLATFFNKQGYKSLFISAVDINFLHQEEFISGAGFTTIIGQEAFSGKQKYVFDAAPDHNLYNKILQTIQKQTDPYLMVTQTISFHKPYNSPYGTTQQEALRYSDKSLFYFYLQLKKSGFFNNGLLVIVGDHRKMEPLEKKEKEALGDFWYTRALATIIGTGITPGAINDNIIQHTDIFYSLKNLVAKGQVTLSKLFNDAFSVKKRRDRGIVYCRYFENDNKFSIVSGKGTGGKMFNNLEDISTSHKFIYQYLSSYISYEQGTGGTLPGKSSMLVIAHQGSPLQVPEESLEGFKLAKQNGAIGIEFDVSQTKDKQNIVLHGERMRATLCGKDYVVYNHTREDLKKNCPLKNGESLMTLEEMLKAVDGMFDYYFVEIKVYNTDDAQQQTLDAIQTVQKLGMQDRVVFTSYDKTATYILGSYKGINAGRDTYNISELSLLPNMNHQYYLMPQTLINENIPKEVDDIGKTLVVYTVNTTGDLEKLYREGVRMIMTDNVPLIKGWADSYMK